MKKAFIKICEFKGCDFIVFGGRKLCVVHRRMVVEVKNEVNNKERKISRYFPSAYQEKLDEKNREIVRARLLKDGWLK